MVDLAGVFLLLLAAGVVLLGTPLTEVRRVVVTGVVHTPPEQVVAAAHSQVGRPLLRVDGGAVDEAARELPWVRGVDLRRRWPHTLVVHVTEATAVAALPRGSGTDGPFRLVDRGGRTIVTAASVPDGVPVVSVDAGGGSGAVRAASAVATALPSDLRSDVERITADSDQDVRLDLVSGPTVRWGSAARSALKARVLAALVAHAAAEDESVRTYDVSAPDAPAIG